MDVREPFTESLKIAEKSDNFEFPFSGQENLVKRVFKSETRNPEIRPKPEFLHIWMLLTKATYMY